MKVGTFAVLATLALVWSGSAAASDQLTLRGYGTAVVDGNLAPGEWSSAGRYDFAAKRDPSDGGGTVPASFYVMNDASNIYLALSVAVTNIGFSAFDTVFHPLGQSAFAEGHDILRAIPTSFEDLHFHQTSPNSWSWLADVDDGGTNDGVSVTQTHPGFVVYEVAHPLNTTDDRHDLSLSIPRHVEFYGSFQHCLSSCVGTFMPAVGYGEIVVVSGTHVPPETTITDGPPDGAELPDYGLYTFNGTDDVAPESELTFECKVDAEEWSACESPFAPVTIPDGWHMLSIRALDDMLNADPTPAQRRWRTDSKRPSKPTVARSRRGKTTQFRFSSSDAGTPARRLRFRCAIDSRRLHACGSRHRVRLPAGRHVLLVRAVDPAGNESRSARVRLR